MADNPFYVAPPDIYKTLLAGQQSYDTSRKRSLNDQLGTALTGSNGIDFKAAAGLAAQNGDPGLALGLIKLGADKEAQANYEKNFGGFLGGSSGQPQGPLPTLMQPPSRVNTSGAPIGSGPKVASTDRVVGDDEGVRLGLYDPPATAGARPPNQPDVAQASPVARSPQTAPGGVPNSTSPASDNIRGLLAATMHPGASAGQRDAAKALLQEALKTPDNIREYDLYSRQERASGREPLTFLDYQIKIKNAGATQAPEKAYKVKVGEDYAKLFSDIQKAGRDAPGAKSILNLMENATHNPDFYSGTASGLITSFKKAATQLGFTIPEGAAPNEMFKSLQNQLVLAAAKGSLGTGFSNADRDYLDNTVPNLQNTPEGNRQLIQVMRKVHERNQVVAARARDYSKRNNNEIDAGFDDEQAQWAEKNPLFPQQKAQDRAPSQADIAAEIELRRKNGTLR